MRISGVTLPDQKPLGIALTTIYGVGRKRALQILEQANIDFHKRANTVTTEEESAIRKLVEELKIEGSLKREVAGNIKRLVDIKAYRGHRHERHLPVRGQRTKTNSRTRRGNVRKTMGSGRKKLEKK